MWVKMWIQQLILNDARKVCAEVAKNRNKMKICEYNNITK